MAKPTVTVASDGVLGPAMLALANDRMRAFVTALCLGARSGVEACRMAGYEGDGNTLKVTAHRLGHDDRVQAALQEEGRRMATVSGVRALQVAQDIMDDDAVAPAARMKAVEFLADRGGFHARTEHRVTVENVTEKEALREVLLGLAKTGMPREKQIEYLRNAGVTVTDVEFEEVEPGGA